MTPSDSSRDSKSGRPRAAGAAPAPRPGPTRTALSQRPVIPVTHPALIAAGLAVAALAVVLISFPISDPDLWQHLTVGKAIWQSHAIPRVHLWTWPSYGKPEAMPSWLFRALLWPIWTAGGVVGLFVWRWVTTLAALAISWATARRLGARGASPLVALVLCVMVYRGRTMVRPETLTAPLFAATLLLLEWRRGGGRLRLAGRDLDPALLLAPIAWVWVNAHISYWLVFFAAGLYWLDALAGEGARSAARSRPRTLLLVSIGAALFCLLNPYGWRLLWQPFEYFLYWRHEPIYQNIGELQPVDWAVNWINGLPLLVLAWPLLALRRLALGRRDLVELILCGTLTALTLSSQRFMGMLAIGAMPFLGRDLAELAAGVRGPLGSARPGARVARALAIVALLATPLLSQAGEWFGVRFDLRGYPIGACDFIERNGLRGRFYNIFQHGGYLLWRFWPDRGRLPFMDIHQTGSREDRDGLAYAVGSFEKWKQMDARHRFEMVLVPRYLQVDLPLPDHLDADTTFALVFVDDAVALYLRRDERRFAPVIAREEFHLLGGGTRKIEALQAVIYRDSSARRALVRELDRSIASTQASSRARYLRGSIAAFEDRLDDAVADFRAGIVADPDARRAHEGIGAIAAVRGRPREAISEYRSEAAKFGWVGGLSMRMGDAYSALGDFRSARHWYERELKTDPANAAARDSLAAIDSRRR